MAGAMSVTAVDGVPTKIGISISDQLGGQFGLVGILAALEARVRTGKGVHLDIAMQDCSVWATQTVWNRPASARSERSAVVRAADGHVLVEGEADRIADFLAGIGGTRSPSADLLAMAEEKGIAVVQIQTVDDVIASGQTAARSLLIDVPTADGTAWRVLGSPLKLCTTPAVVRSAMPALGFPHPELVSEFGLKDLKDRRGFGRTKTSVEA
jgi:crotonobetainyl-CoA:carnitine CoA-transferase CaiB-like acyl-CoA transferase